MHTLHIRHTQPQTYCPARSPAPDGGSQVPYSSNWHTAMISTVCLK